MQKAYQLAQAHVGTWEWRDGSNPAINRMFAECGHPNFHDDTAWCAAFVGSMLFRAGMPHTGKLNARSYLEWGKPVPRAQAEEGDVVVMWRTTPRSWQGHVGFLVKDKGNLISILGGNQNDQVNVRDYPATRVLGFRRHIADTTNEPKAAGSAGCTE